MECLIIYFMYGNIIFESSVSRTMPLFINYRYLKFNLTFLKNIGVFVYLYSISNQNLKYKVKILTKI